MRQMRASKIEFLPLGKANVEGANGRENEQRERPGGHARLGVEHPPEVGGLGVVERGHVLAFDHLGRGR